MLGQLSLFEQDVTLPLRQRVQVELISAAQARYTLEKWHYLKRARVGRQLNYAVIIDGAVDGVITYAYPMISVPIDGVPADEVIEFARLFLYSNIPHTATCAVGKSLRRVLRDWMRLFPDSKRPRLVVSWSDTEYHKGTIYKAANFRWLKRTKGQAHGNKAGSKRGTRVAHGDYNHDKDCWLFDLTREGER
jgi:hypothetical protein